MLVIYDGINLCLTLEQERVGAKQSAPTWL